MLLLNSGRSMSDLLHNHICANGFEDALEGLIAYAETQSKLHQSYGDRSQWLFWVRAWANLQRASDAIAFPMDDSACLEMWKEYQEGYAGADVDFGFPEI